MVAGPEINAYTCILYVTARRVARPLARRAVASARVLAPALLVCVLLALLRVRRVEALPEDASSSAPLADVLRAELAPASAPEWTLRAVPRGAEGVLGAAASGWTNASAFYVADPSSSSGGSVVAADASGSVSSAVAGEGGSNLPLGVGWETTRKNMATKRPRFLVRPMRNEDAATFCASSSS